MPYVPRSLNFAHLACFDEQFDKVGHDCESLVYSNPSLAIVLARQLAELFATATLDHRGIAVPDFWPDGTRLQLFDHLQMLGRSNANTGLRSQLEQLRKFGNEYTHVRYKRPYRPPLDVARKCIHLAYDAGRWFQTTFGSPTLLQDLRLPQPGGQVTQPVPVAVPVDNLFIDLEAELDRCEHIIDVSRGLTHEAERETIQRLRQRISATANQRRLENWQPSYLELRLASIEVAGQCHRGEQPKADDLSLQTQQIVDQVVRDPQGQGIEQAILFHNRWMILQSNGYRFETTYDRLLELANSQRERARITASQLGVPFVPDQQLGRFLGSLGQLTAMTAWEITEWGMLDDASACFNEARQHFTDSPDTTRQDTYWGHVVAEKLRFNKPLLLSDKDSQRWAAICKALVDSIQTVAEKPFTPDTRSQAFGLALRLKVDFLTNKTPPRMTSLTNALSATAQTRLQDDDWCPDNPYEQILGLLGMHVTRQGGGVPRGLRLTMERIASTPTLRGFIATVYQAQWDFMRGESTAGASIIAGLAGGRDGWPCGKSDELTLRLRESCQKDGGGPWSILPFNFA